MRPANVCPTRIDNSSVANAKSLVWPNQDNAKDQAYFGRTLAKGIIERNETDESNQKSSRAD